MRAPIILAMILGCSSAYAVDLPLANLRQMATVAALPMGCAIDAISDFENGDGLNFALVAGAERVSLAIPQRGLDAWSEGVRRESGVPYWRFDAESAAGLGRVGQDRIVRLSWIVNNDSNVTSLFEVVASSAEGVSRTIECR